MPPRQLKSLERMHCASLMPYRNSMVLPTPKYSWALMASPPMSITSWKNRGRPPSGRSFTFPCTKFLCLRTCQNLSTFFQKWNFSFLWIICWYLCLLLNFLEISKPVLCPEKYFDGKNKIWNNAEVYRLKVKNLWTCAKTTTAKITSWLKNRRHPDISKFKL